MPAIFSVYFLLYLFLHFQDYILGAKTNPMELSVEG